MNKAQGLYDFWSSFGWPAYDENTVPDDAPYPRITYEVKTDSLDHVVLSGVSLWDRSSSWEKISKKADEIAKAIVDMYPPAIKLDDGRIYITKGTPFTNRMGDANDDSIRRIYLNINTEFLTSN